MKKLVRLMMAAMMAASLSLAGIGITVGTATVEPASYHCTPGYKPCIPKKASDVDCLGGSGNGPRYTKPGVVYTVKPGFDRYGLDSDKDGKGCE